MVRVHLRGSAVVLTLMGAQAIISVLGAALAWATGGIESAAAALYGGAVAIVPAGWFAIRVFARSRGASAGQVLGWFYRAEFEKFVFSALLFIGGALMFGQHFAPLILTCMACFVANWLLLAVAVID